MNLKTRINHKFKNHIISVVNPRLSTRSWRQNSIKSREISGAQKSLCSSSIHVLKYGLYPNKPADLLPWLSNSKLSTFFRKYSISTGPEWLSWQRVSHIPCRTLDPEFKLHTCLFTCKPWGSNTLDVKAQGFEALGRRHLKSKTGVSMPPQKGLMSCKTILKLNKKENIQFW